ncbi:SDR family oxidoreductase [Paraburkholderia sp. LEh10]|uniref:SDR family oxidoreductase n=1 Tax=Paraburkholderia sp. LEh10 TaxID=2821353 RepID=UPI001AE8CF7E|nr:SDR family oxidoreductase [Paraburkholderia sp. LEh10]MBP0589574.1 SDR family oxidoreductase [Paraburkholderia sp. LEh10]
MSTLLIGASGRTGRLVAEKLHSAAMPFCAMIRNAAKRAEFERLGARTVVADLAADFSHAFGGTDTVIYAAGSSETEGAEQERLIDRDAVMKSADYAKQHGAKLLVVISALLAYDPEQSPQALRHYSEMKRESDDYVMASGVDYLILRPGTLTTEPAAGTIELVSHAGSALAPVAREDVAIVLLEALNAKLMNKVIGFAGGTVPIRDALKQA